jgi:hypothetical protein
MFQYPIPEHALEEWKSRVAVDSHSATILAKAMALSLLDSLEFPFGEISPEGHRETSQDTTAHVLDLATHLQSILGEVMDMASIMFPHRTAPSPSRSTLPHHIWPNSARHDVANIRRRAKDIRRLVRLESNPRHVTEEDLSPLVTHISPWSSVNTPLPLRMVLSPPPRGLDILGLFTREELHPGLDIPPSQALQACYKGLRQMIRHLMRHARNIRRLKYGKALLRMFVKKPNVTLKSILRTTMGTSTHSTLPTDLSIIKDETI